MSLNIVDFHGVHMLGPENFMCALLRGPEDGRILPVWISAFEGANLAAREQGETPRRPGTHDLLADALSRQEGGVSTIAITSYHEGVFIATITAGGEDLDARASDALILAEILGLTVMVDDDVWSQAALYVSDEALDDYFDLQFEDSPGTPTVDTADVDADFQEMMRSMGLADDGDEASSDDSEDTGDEEK